MFAKRPSELRPEDIQRVIDEQWQEGSQIELKGALPARGNEADPWMADQSRVGDAARNDLVKEVIAFANAYGGWLLLGVQETDDKPARARSMEPLPACAELAERLRLMCRDCIEPQLPVFEVAGVPMADDGFGVVVFHVPRSRMAPHRHTVTRECYVRRADRSEKMSMREIQDLTLQVERGLAAIERQFDDRREQFASALRSFVAGDLLDAFGMRASLVPLTPLQVDRVHGNDAVKPPAHVLWGAEDGRAFQIGVPMAEAIWRPLVRGTECASVEPEHQNYRALFGDGLIEYRILEKHLVDLWINVDHVMAVAANSMLAAEMFRRAAGAPDAEYAMEIEIRLIGTNVLLHGHGIQPPAITRASNLRQVFPRYSVGSREEFGELWSLFERDFWHAVGKDWGDWTITLDFDRAFRELGIVANDVGG